MLQTLSDSILSVIYPQECEVCNNEVEFSDDGIACSECWEETKIFSGDETLCSKCGAFLFGASSADPALCGKCDEHSYDRAVAAGIYEKALAASILRLKRTPYTANRLKKLLAAALERTNVESDTIVIPVPLSSRRQRERGFNQAALIGRFVARHRSLRLDETSLVRRIHTPMHRVGMDKKARALTVRNAFEVVRPMLIDGKTILLVDDIFTSGETASNCARVLKKSGAAIVNVLTIARTA